MRVDLSTSLFLLLVTLQVSRTSASSTTCERGFYANNDTCALCPRGTYSPRTNEATFCQACDLGFQSSVGQSVCFQCSAGRFSLNRTGLCVETCPLNTYNQSEPRACIGCGFGYGSYLNTTCVSVPVLTWKWISGSSGRRDPPVYTPQMHHLSELATPGQRTYSVSFTRKAALFLFGGRSVKFGSVLNDLWKFENNVWVWISGTSLYDQKGVFGEQGIAGTHFHPGGLEKATLSVIGETAFLFGGYGFNNQSYKSVLNTMWKLDTTTLEWTWLHGSSSRYVPCHFPSEKGVFSQDFCPSNRRAMCSASMGDIVYVFGGNPPGPFYLNDLWAFDSMSNTWAWVSGNSSTNVGGHYNALNPNLHVYPGSRFGSICEAHNSGVFIFGGSGYDSNGEYGFMNDVWEYRTVNDSWYWKTGSSVRNSVGIYPPKLTRDGGIPSARHEMGSAVFNNAMLIFGGETIQSPLNDMWYYHFDSNEFIWLTGSSTPFTQTKFGQGGFPGSRFGTVTQVMSKHLVIYGGQSSDLWQLRLASSEDEGNFECGPGTFHAMGLCLHCQVGTFSSTSGRSFCELCAPGYESLTLAATACSSCKIGRYGRNDGTCMDCIVGKFSNSTGSLHCYPCAWWEFSSRGSSACAVCSTGKYSLNGTGLCVDKCPLNTYNLSTARACFRCGLGFKTRPGNDTCVTQAMLTWNWAHSEIAESSPIYAGLNNNSERARPGHREFGASFVYDKALFLFGGDTNKERYLQDFWRFNNSIWTWIAGVSSVGQVVGTFGPRGRSGPEFSPGGTIFACMERIEKSAYLFGGESFYDRWSTGLFNALWKFDIAGLTWTWLRGHSHVDGSAVRGIKGVFNPEFTPNARQKSGSTTIGTNMYIFGGSDRSGLWVLNDLWVFNASSNMWAWISGSSMNNSLGVYTRSDLGLFQPGGRHSPACESYGSSIYVFGGEGFGSSGIIGYLNDIWEYDTEKDIWSWKHGTSVVNNPGLYSRKLERGPGFPRARSTMGSAVYRKGMIITAGFSFSPYSYVSDIWFYYFEINEFVWLLGSSDDSIPVPKPEPELGPRAGMLHEVMGNELFVFGGEGDLFNIRVRSNLWSLRLSYREQESKSECGPGKFYQSGSCFFCSIGRFSRNTSVKNSTCSACPQGYGSSGASTGCTQCHPGSYALPESECLACTSGRFSDVFGSSNCQACGLGYESLTASSSCTTCIPGTYDPGSHQCTHCQRGTFNNISGASHCDLCPPGHESSGASTQCIACSIGTYEAGNRMCLACLPGKYANMTGATLCQTCPQGYQSSLNRSQCEACTAGRFYDSILHECLQCPASKFSEIPRAFNCTDCARGHISQDGASFCTACPAGQFTISKAFCAPCLPGKFQNAPAQDLCEECPRASWTPSYGFTFCKSCSLSGGSTEELNKYGPQLPQQYSDCYCIRGYYGTPYTTGGGVCKECSGGVECPQNTSLPIVLPGFVRAPEDPGAAFPCTPREACLGSLTQATGCAEGYVGDFCEDCVQSEYFRKNEKCEKCSKFSQFSFVFYFVAIIVSLYVLLENSTPNHTNIHVFTVTFFWLQILDLLSSTVEEWPSNIVWLFKLAALLNFDMEIFEPECSFAVTYWMKWHLKMTSGLVLGAMQLYFFVYQEYTIKHSYIFDRNYPQRALEYLKTLHSPKAIILALKTLVATVISTAIAKTKKLLHWVKSIFSSQKTPTPQPTIKTLIDSDDLDQMFPYRFSRYVFAYGVIVNSIYVMIAKTSFEMFQCDQQSTGIYTIHAYVKQQCYDQYWYQIAFTNLVFSAHWLLGFPLYLTYVFIRKRNEISTEAVGKHYGSYMLFYKTETYLWPVAEILFKLCAVASTQLLCFYFPLAGYISLAALVVVYDVCLVCWQPYKSKKSAWLSFLYV